MKLSALFCPLLPGITARIMRQIGVVLLGVSCSFAAMAQAIDGSFKSPFTNDVIYTMALQKDGRMVVGGGLSSSHAGNIVRLNTDGTVDAGFVTGSGFNGAVRVIISQADDKLVVGGSFSSYNGTPAKGIVRLDKDGKIDPGFQTATGIDGNYNGVYTVVMQGDGKLLVGGYITSYAGSPANMVVRLNVDGSQDKTFKASPDYNGTVLALAVQRDGKLLVGGLVVKNSDNKGAVVMIRLNSDGTVDGGFTSSASSLNSVNSIVVQPDDKILVGGDFDKYNDRPYSAIVRLLGNGDIDESFKTGDGFYALHGGIITYPIYTVSNISLLSDGRMMVSGSFTKYRGTSVDGIIRLGQDGAVDGTYQACGPSRFNGTIYHIETQPDGKVIAGGYFNNYRNTPNTICLFRLNADASHFNLVSDFKYVIDGNNVSFINKSAGGTSYNWDFGDQNSSQLANPFHRYATVGAFDITLNVSDNCNSASSTLSFALTGLNDVYARTGGNTGPVTVDVRGAGFVPGMKVYLQKSGVDSIPGDTLFLKSASLMTTTFDLSQRQTGTWNVIAVFPDGRKDTVYDGFKIEQGSTSDLSVNIYGDGVLRIGFNQIYNVVYRNNGNTDVNWVPLLVSGLPMGTDIEILDPLFKLADLPGYDTLNLGSYPIKHTYNDSLLGMSYRQFIIGTIPAGATRTLNFIFHIPQSTPLHSFSKIEVSLGTPASQGTTAGNGNNGTPEGPDFNVECFNNVVEVAESMVLDKMLNKIYKTDPTGIAKCLGTGAQVVHGIYKIVTSDFGNKSKEERLLESSEVALTMAKMTLPCVRAGLSVAAVLQPELLPEVVEANETLMAEEALGETAAEKVAEKILDDAGDVIEAKKTLNGCLPLLKHTYVNYIMPIIGNATDPNQKFGPGDSSASHFVLKDPFGYVINFENKKEANLNAQTVTVIDTLRKSYFDLASFGFTSVTIGDSVFALSSPVTSFSHDFDFTALYGVKARVVALFDTTTGIAQWNFFTIDPRTNQTTTNALAGFLPPDVTSPGGQGYVSYTVKPNPDLKTGDSVFNRAAIKFDANPVIYTNVWKNVFDLVKPSSKVDALPAQTTDTTFTVSWKGKDSASGILQYDIYQATNGDPYQLWKVSDTARQDLFTGVAGTTYHFFSIARDNAGNREDMKSAAEASITVSPAQATGTTNATPLTGKLDNAGLVILNWSTVTEFNNKGFSIQRNAGSTWDSIGFVEGAGNSQVKLDYSYTDAAVLRDQSYKYRYKQTSNDGSVVYSNEVTISTKDTVRKLTLKITPNPSSGTAKLIYSVPEQTNVSIRLFDFAGRPVADVVHEGQGPGVYTYDFSASHYALTAGIYLVVLQTDSGKVIAKMELFR